jgi:F0F1-type ATP synthase membrane subunit b/b'
MSSLEEAQELLKQAEKAEAFAKETLAQAERDRKRAEWLISQAEPVAEKLRERRKLNGFTDMVERMFRGEPT